MGFTISKRFHRGAGTESISVPALTMIALLACGMFVPSQWLHARQLYPEPERIVPAASLVSPSSFVLTDGGYFVFREFDDVRSVDSANPSAGPQTILEPGETFEFAGETYTFNQLGTFAQSALFHVLSSEDVLVRAMITPPGAMLPVSAFLMLSPEGEVRFVLLRNELPGEVNPTAQFGLCSGSAHDVMGIEHVIAACILPGVEENSYSAVLFGGPLDHAPTEDSSVVYPLPGAYPVEPADMHQQMLVSSFDLGGLDKPAAFIVDAQAAPGAYSGDPDRLRWGFRADPYLIASDAVGTGETTGVIGTLLSNHSHGIGSPGPPIYGETLDAWPRRQIGLDRYVQSTAMEVSDETLFLKGVSSNVPLFDDTVAAAGEGNEYQRECDCSLLDPFGGDMLTAAVEVALCITREEFTERCQEVNFAGGDSITMDDLDCLRYCRSKLERRDTDDIPIHEDIMLHLAVSGEPMPVYDDLTLAFFLGLAGSTDGVALFALGGHTGEQDRKSVV